MNREAASSRLGVAIAAAGLGAVALAVALLLGERYKPRSGPSIMPSRAPLAEASPEIPGVRASSPTKAGVTGGQRESVEVPPQPAAPIDQVADPCNDVAIARETLGKALGLLQCSNPEVVALMRDFLETIQPDPEANFSAELKSAILEAKTDAFAAAVVDVHEELGDLSRRQPNAYIYNKDLPPEYAATRIEIHSDEYGTPRPMIVTYAGSTGRGFTVPASTAGQRMALQMIMMHGEVEPEWHALFLRSSQPR
jgi:hypothetical protein